MADSADGTYRVSGLVASRVSAAVAGLRVSIVDRGVNDDAELVSAQTDGTGSYSVTIDAATVKKRGKARLDLQARVFSGATLVGRSVTRYNAAAKETLNVLLDKMALPNLASEYESLTTALTAQYAGKPGDLKENPDRGQITYLANKTGWDARAVALVALADQFSRNSGAPPIPAEYFYALFRAGVASNDNTLYQTPAATVQAIWKQAIGLGVLPQAAEKGLAEVVKQFQSLGKQKLLTAAASVGISKLTDVLAVSGLSDAQQTEFASLYSASPDDPTKFWAAATEAFGKDLTARLQVNGRLADFTLNNAPLIQSLHKSFGGAGITDTSQLAAEGYHSPDKWNAILTAETKIPAEIPGGSAAEQRSNYGQYLAARVRLGYPTASLAEMVGSNFMPVDARERDNVQKFLLKQQANFDIGAEPLKLYLARTKTAAPPAATVAQIERLQRVQQITPTDQAMRVLLSNKGLDAAYHIVRRGRDLFIQDVSQKDVGLDAATAGLIYDRAVQVHNVVFNITLGYLGASSAPDVGVHSPAGIIDSGPANVGDLVAGATLETLFQSMDYCACDECRSILSPAAYLVDLLDFLDRGKPTAGKTPFDVFSTRRPDVQSLPLTCENTNTALPYIDLVNETLEYYVANKAPNPPLSLTGYQGHDTGTSTSEDLLAAPQFVRDDAYALLKDASFPSPLPFHQPLEALRRYFAKLEAPLPYAMERLRKDDQLERSTNLYGWRDILMEEIGLSRGEYDLLTTARNAPPNQVLWLLYGFPPNTVDADVIAGIAAPQTTGLANARRFCRRMNISYDDLVAVLQSQFVNPGSDLLPQLQKLGVSFAIIQAVNSGAIADITPYLPTGAAAPDPTEYGGTVSQDINKWILDPANYARIMGLITLAVPLTIWAPNTAYKLGACIRPIHPPPDSTLYYECTNPGTSAAAEPNWPTATGLSISDGVNAVWISRDLTSTYSFGDLVFRYADPTRLNQDIGVTEFVRLLRFIRLMKKLNWTVDQTDAALCALLPRPAAGQTFADTINSVEKLNAGFLTLLPMLGVIVRLMRTLKIKPGSWDFLALLALWSDIGTHGVNSFFRQLFLNPALREQDPSFDDNGYGKFFVNADTLLPSAATISGSPTVGDVLTTTIGGIPVSYTVVAADNTLFTLAQHIATRINAAVTPLNGQPLNQVIRAASAGATVTFQAVVAGTSFTLNTSVSPAATEIYAVVDHISILRSAMNLTGDEFTLIANALQFNPATPLNLANISSVLRRGWLARKLNISVRELLSLISSTGLDPFAASDPTNPAVMRLVLLVQALKSRALPLGAALYLIWNQDLSGNSAPDDQALTQLARTLRVAYAAVADQFVSNNVPDPDGSLAQTQMAAVYGSAVATFFFGLLNSTFAPSVPFGDPDALLASRAAFTAIQAAAGTAESGDPKLAYDDFRKQLSFGGVLSATVQAAIKTAADNNAGGIATANFKTAVDNLYAANQAAVAPFFAAYPQLKTLCDNYEAAAGTPQAKRTALLQQILPDLIRTSQQQQTLQTLTATLAIDAAFAPTLIQTAAPDGSYAIHALASAAQPAINDFLALKQAGLSVEFFAGDSLAAAPPKIVAAGTETIAPQLDYGPVAGASSHVLPPNPAVAGAAICGHWRGYVEAPANGFFNVYIDVDASATVTLVLDGTTVIQTTPATLNTTRRENATPVTLTAGNLYQVDLTVEKVKTTVRLQWGWTPQGQPIATIPARYLYPATVLDTFEKSYIRFMKAASLATGLKLTAAEIAWLATGGWLNSLPVQGSANAATAVALLTQLRTLLDYSRIKADISPDDESLLDSLQSLGTATVLPADLLAMTRWDVSSVAALLQQFGLALTDLAVWDNFRRVYDAYAVVAKTGIAAKTLIGSATNEPSGSTVRDMQAALRARYDAESWRELVRPINDDMRELQRDALVAYILQQMSLHVESQSIDSSEKLFEYFLMDVEMEPCMETSRVRHALSSVQLFVERCLMNLESKVPPDALVAPGASNPWDWMKRYRVWEANRKVFLFPENWLDPELRDDKSPFFKEAESELLQSDITDDVAAIAMLNYLSKLQEVAKLEPVGIHHVEADPNLQTGAVDHVVARTAGAHRKYFYRRRDSSGWSPWEQIKLDIEDNPVIPYVWNDPNQGSRLMLFWLKVLKQSFTDPSALSFPSDPSTSDPANAQSMTELHNNAKTDAAGNSAVQIGASLCWSEYYNGKWQPTRTSDIHRPALYSTYANGGKDFDRARMEISIEVNGDALEVHFRGTEFFTLYNTYSLPVISREVEEFTGLRRLLHTSLRRFLHTTTGALQINYWQNWQSFPPDVVLHFIQMSPGNVPSQALATRTVEPHHALSDVWLAPFFMEDRRYAFYVTPTFLGETTSWGPPPPVVQQIPIKYEVLIPPMIYNVPTQWPNSPGFGGDGPIDPDGVLNQMNNYGLQRGLSGSMTINYGDSAIGLATSAPNAFGAAGGAIG